MALVKHSDRIDRGSEDEGSLILIMYWKVLFWKFSLEQS